LCWHLDRFAPLALTLPWRQLGGEPTTVLLLTWTRERGALKPIKALSEYLGHADPGFTLRTYTHLMPTSAERTRRAVDAVLGPGHDEGPASPREGGGTGADAI
jgi:hypothetical protein